VAGSLAWNANVARKDASPPPVRGTRPEGARGDAARSSWYPNAEAGSQDEHVDVAFVLEVVAAGWPVLLVGVEKVVTGGRASIGRSCWGRVSMRRISRQLRPDEAFLIRPAAEADR
jgi:hypothetical protein